MDWRNEVWRVAKLLELEYMTPEAAISIGNLWEILKPQRVLEIGTFKGTGACYLGAMAACYDGHVWTVDLPWTAQPNKHFTRLAEHFVAECGLTNITIVRRDDGAEGFLKDHFIAANPPFDFIYIDGGHEWLHTAAQYAASFAAIKRGGWLCFDDLKSERYPDVDLVWRKLVLPRHKKTYELQRMGFAMREN